MSKRAYISRYLLILKKLKAKPYSTYEELQCYIDTQSEYLQMHDDTLNMSFSKRTLQRDLREIRNLFGMEIAYSKQNRGYFISQAAVENMNFQRIIDTFDLFNSLNMAEDLAPYIYLEKRKPHGTENLPGLLYAIKNRFQVKFIYQKFGEGEGRERLADPYVLKEFKNRWYMIAKDCQDGMIKSFGLDRLTHTDITRNSFEYPNTFSIEENYRYCFGIISPNGKKPEEIILSFDPYQGKYIKSLPLHNTQQILIDNNDELQVKLKLCITFDFVMELLSFADNVKVIKPKSLVTEIKKAYKKALQLYES